MADVDAFISQDSALPLMKYAKKCVKKNHFAILCKSKAKMNMLDIDTELSEVDKKVDLSVQ